MAILLWELPIFRSNVVVKTKGTVMCVRCFEHKLELRRVIFTGENSGFSLLRHTCMFLPLTLPL